jgi:MFS family permease
MQGQTAKVVSRGEQRERRSGTGRGATFRALQHRNFRLFWYGQLISLVGTWMQQVAQQLLVYRVTDSATKLGIVAAAGSLPVLLLSLWAGVLVDRVSKRTLIVMTQVASMVLAFVLAGLVYWQVVQFWHIVVLATLLGCVNAIDMPARQSFVSEMVDREDLANAVALNSSVFNAARVVGPAVAGLLVAALGEAVAFTINGVSFLAVIAGLMMMRLPPFESDPSHRAALVDLLDGLRYVARDPFKRVLMSALVVQTIFGTFHMTLMPVFARDVLIVRGVPLLADSGVRLGFLSASFGLGALLAAVLLAGREKQTPPGVRIMIGLVLYPLAFLLFALVRSFWLALPLLMLGGWAMITLLATTNTLFQTTTPAALRGRVMSLYTLALVGLMPFGNLLAGFLAERLHSASLAVGLGQIVVMLTALAVYLFAPYVRQATYP